MCQELPLKRTTEGSRSLPKQIRRNLGDAPLDGEKLSHKLMALDIKVEACSEALTGLNGRRRIGLQSGLQGGDRSPTVRTAIAAKLLI